MNTKLTALALSTVMAVAALPAAAAPYDIDTAHSSVGFQIKHLAISKVNGSFNEFSGNFVFVEGDPSQWSAEAVIQAASIDTGNKDRDDHLRSADFFDVENFPTITFKSTGVIMTDATEGVMKGALTMHGVTKDVELDLEFLGTVTDPWGNEKAGFSLSGKIDRRDFGLTWNKALETGGLVVDHTVKIMLEIEGNKAK
ncbi:YceI family protein [bacterium]|nr:YceI family protein [bacterium]